MDRTRRRANNRPFDDTARKDFYNAKKEYKKQLKSSKTDYKNKLNTELGSSNSINWNTLSKLRNINSNDNGAKKISKSFTFSSRSFTAKMLTSKTSGKNSLTKNLKFFSKI